MNSLKRFIALVFIGLSTFSYSQNYLGVHSSNYAGVMGTDLNPASFVDGRFKVDINLASFNFGAWTNAAHFDTKDMPKWWTKSFKPDNGWGGNDLSAGDNPYNDWMQPDSTFDSRYIVRLYDQTSSKPVGFYNNIQVDALNFMFHINPKIAVGFAGKFRSITNVDDIDPTFATLLEKDFLSNDADEASLASTLWDAGFNEELLDVNHMSWMEYGLIYSQVIKDDGEHFMKVGGKIKWLSGYSAAYMHTENFSYNVDNDSVFNTVSGDFSYGHSDGLLEEMGNEGYKFDPMNSASKFGIGGDLGFVYEWRPDWKEYKYDMDGETNIWRRDQGEVQNPCGTFYPGYRWYEIPERWS